MRRDEPDNLEQVAIPGINELQIGRATIEFSAETVKKNPNSLRFIIGHIVNFFFDGVRKSAAERMSREGGRYAPHKEGLGPKAMNVKALAEILNDDDYITYWHLEAVSKSIDLPVGALLLLSRVYALVRDGKREEAHSFIHSVRSFCGTLEEVAKHEKISRGDFDQMVHSFAALAKAEERNLFDYPARPKR